MILRYLVAKPAPSRDTVACLHIYVEHIPTLSSLFPASSHAAGIHKFLHAGANNIRTTFQKRISEYQDSRAYFCP